MGSFTRILSTGAGLLLLVAMAPLFAHHSFGAEYDATQPVTITGVITKVEWMNPHAEFFMDVKNDQGKVANWRLQGYPPSVLYRTGWKRAVTLKPGDTVTVFGWRARDGTNWAHARQVTLSDGKKLYWGPPSGTGDGGDRPIVDQ